MLESLLAYRCTLENMICFLCPGNPDLSLLCTTVPISVSIYVEAELESRLYQQKRQQISSISSIKFRTAFEQLNKKHGLLTSGIENRFIVTPCV